MYVVKVRTYEAMFLRTRDDTGNRNGILGRRARPYESRTRPRCEGRTGGKVEIQEEEGYATVQGDAASISLNGSCLSI